MLYFVVGVQRQSLINRLKSVMLRNTLFVPEMELNLVSCSTLCTEDFNVQFGPHGCSVMKGGNFFISSQVRNGLYPVETCKMKRSVNAASTTRSKWHAGAIDEELWHERFGHANTESVQNLLRSNAIQDPKIRLSPTTRELCISCAKGKQSRSVRHTKQIKARKVVEIVPSDVCGPISTESLGGSRYYVSFVDKYPSFMKLLRFRRKVMSS